MKLSSGGARANTFLGIDIGGANLKYATSSGDTLAKAFPLWQCPDQLRTQLRQDIASLPADRVVVTMTGELADCFLDRDEGVRRIVRETVAAVESLGLYSPTFYAVDGNFHDADSARQNVDLVAAANWHALASFVATTYTGPLGGHALLADIGSTTTDLVPIRDGQIGTAAQTDFDRLREGSLVYVGGERTPVCALVDAFCFRGETVPIMREVFATMDDARLLLGHTPPAPSDCASADGKPRDAFHAANRMARMIGLDHRSVSIDEAIVMAEQVHRSAMMRIETALKRCRSAGLLADDAAESNWPWIVSGHADDLLALAKRHHSIIHLSELLGSKVSRSAPAYAIAKLAEQLS